MGISDVLATPLLTQLLANGLGKATHDGPNAQDTHMWDPHEALGSAWPRTSHHGHLKTTLPDGRALISFSVPLAFKIYK